MCKQPAHCTHNELAKQVLYALLSPPLLAAISVLHRASPAQHPLSRTHLLARTPYLMPGPHLELKLMQCYADVGGADGWLSGHWDQGSQWWTGWHLPGPAGPAGLRAWSWPNDQWVLIGFERWDSFRKFPHTRLREAYYQFPNPIHPCSMASSCRPLPHQVPPQWPPGVLQVGP